MNVSQHAVYTISLLFIYVNAYTKQREPVYSTSSIYIPKKADVANRSSVSPEQKEMVRDSPTNPADDWRSTLFGEQGILTAIFRMLDQQRKIASNNPSYKINDVNNFDLKKVFDMLLREDARGDFVDPKSELSEFLGLCNKLSCGDIYKSIDKFRRSELFTNFQIALSLIQDPNGWETIGNLLSNPELISQFVAGTGMEELVGSALGDKKELAKKQEMKSKLMPEDGDFGIEFIDGTDEKGLPEKKTEGELPEIDFSVDGKGGEDYYEQVSEVIDETTPPPVATSTLAMTTTTTMTTEPPLPEISFSIDGDGEEVETVQVPAPSINIQVVPSPNSTPPPARPPSFMRRSVSTVYPPIITRTSPTTTLPTTTTVRTTVRTTTTSRLTTTVRNHRKDSDYYAMYYDEQPQKLLLYSGHAHILARNKFHASACSEVPQPFSRSEMSHNRKKDEERRHHIEFLCGWAAGCIETCILYPSNKIIFRQQLHGFSAKVAWSQVKSEGIHRLYRGLLPPLIMRTSSRAVMFGLYDKFQSSLRCPHSPPNTSFTLCHAQAAFLAGICEASLCPLERVQVLLQTSAFHDRFKNTAETFWALRAFGYREYYRGISMVMIRNSLSNALFFTLREPFKKAVMDAKPTRSLNTTRILADFASGAILGATISTVFFPLNVVKNHMQSKVGVAYDNPLRVFSEVWQERQRSLRGLYLGVHLNFTRSLLAWGIINSTYELLRRTFRPLEDE
ncbi:unnamed protein product [Cylicocyclus nassatus]|uniref:Uncharacterized protein n=1 Tax=Cylicocyclus nassatus TaxID=53992 RepID=A0AA36HGW7_CYLNA|nr:unnamed protein product [Cylicocyclus nassatus]